MRSYLVRVAIARFRARRDDLGTDRGFLLLETVVAIMIITVVMAALTTLLIDTTHSTVRQRSAQGAAQIAVSALDKANSLGGADVVHGRDSDSVNAQVDSALAQRPSVASWLADMTPAVDASASAGQGADADSTALPTVPVTQTVNGATYDVSYFVGDCWRPALGSGDCVATQTAAATAQSGQVSAIQQVPVPYVRVVAVVSWTASGCPSVGCDYESAIVLNDQTDPVFNFDQTSPTGPSLLPVPDQTSTLGQVVDGVSGVGDCDTNCPITATGGVSPLIFSGTVQLGGGAAVAITSDTACSDDAPTSSPTASATSSATASATNSPTASATATASATPSSSPSVDASASYGFLLDPTCGLITGTPTQSGTYTITISVVDSFLNSDQVSFTWTVSSGATSSASTTSAPPTSTKSSTPAPSPSTTAPSAATCANAYQSLSSPRQSGTLYDYPSDSNTVPTSCTAGSYTYVIYLSSYTIGGYTYQAQPGMLMCNGSRVSSNLCTNTSGDVTMYNPTIATYHFTVKITPKGGGQSASASFDWTIYSGSASSSPTPSPTWCRYYYYCGGH